MKQSVLLKGPLLPMLASSSLPFDDENFLFELKWDGVRCMTAVGDQVLAWGKDGQNYSGRYPELDVLRALPVGTILDGELVAVENGLPDFHALMRRHRRQRSGGPVQYVVFDILSRRGDSLLHVPLRARRDELHALVTGLDGVSCCEGVIGTGQEFFRRMTAAGHEGVVAKRLSSRYAPGKRSDAWRKIKRRTELPCVVIGYTVDRDGLKSLLLATLKDKKLQYVGGVEMGVPGTVLRELEGVRRASPVVPCSQKARWVEPRKFCVVRFHGWRPSGPWRDPVFGGWADDDAQAHPRHRMGAGF
jgi:bifunctional non-homologous end joining protein LigD